MITLAIYNIKGGVGKTATAVNLAWLAARNSRVLVWDLDPQGAATFYFRVKPKVKGGIDSVLGSQSEVADRIRGSDFENLDVLPADFSYRNMDLSLGNESKPLRQVRKTLKQVSNDYDYVFLDCPPSISLVSENIFHASDALVVPMIPTTLSMRTLQQLLKFCRENGLGDLPIHPFFSMVDQNKRMHMQIMERMLQRTRSFMASSIPYASEIEQMGIHRAPVVSYSKAGPGSAAYQRLWTEIQFRLRRGS